MENLNLKNHSNVCGVEETKIVENQTNVVEKLVRKKRVESPYLKTFSKARNIFRNQIDKSVDTKRASLKRAFDRVASGNFTFIRLLTEFKDQVERLQDSRRFEKDCIANNLNYFNAATHIAFDGASKIDKVLKNGLKANYSIQFTEMVDPLFTEQELKCATEPNSKCSPQGEDAPNDELDRKKSD